MSDLLVQVELNKLAAELGVDPSELTFLDDLPEEVLRTLRGQIAHALFAPHEPRFTRIAALAKMVPASLSAKASELALGPLLSARVAGLMDVGLAVKLAGSLSPGFLAKMSPFLDPTKVGPIVQRLDERLVLDVATRLIAGKEYFTLGRFVTEVPVETALKVMAGASADDLLQAALYTEDRSVLDTIIGHLSDEQIAGVMHEGVAAGKVDDALALLRSISVEARRRAVEVTSTLDVATRNAVLEAAWRRDVWGDLLPVLGLITDAQAIGRLVNVPVALDPALLEEILVFGKAHGVGGQAIPVIMALDEEHRAVLPEIAALADPEMQSWLRSVATTPEAKAVCDDVLAKVR